MELNLRYCLKDELRLRYGTAFSFSSLEDMKHKFYKKFREQEKERGYGLNTFIRPVSQEFEILENDEISLVGEEVEFSYEMVLEESQKETQKEEPIPNEGYSSSNPFLEAMKWSEEHKDEEKEEGKQVIKPVKNNSLGGIDENLGVRKDEVKVGKIYVNLVDFIKDNPNCTVSEAEKFFSKKEINKQIKLGKVYFRRGRLSV